LIRASAQPLVAQPLADVLAEYTAARWARVARVARASRRLGAMLQAQNRMGVRARDALLGRLSPRLLARATAASAAWTPPGGAEPAGPASLSVPGRIRGLSGGRSGRRV